MSINIGELATLATEDYAGTLADNVTNHNPLLKKLSENGNKKTYDGGSKIRQELDYAENGTFKWYSGYELLNVNASEVFDAADFEVKFANVNVTISGEEMVKVSGDAARINLVKSKIKNAERTAKNQVASSLFSDGTGSDGKEIGGLQLLIADDPTTGTVGGISRSANTFWRNQTYDFSTEAGGAATSANIVTGMNKLYIRTTRNADMIDMVVADTNYFELYEAYLQDIKRVTVDSEADAGYMTLKYKGVSVFHDSNAPTDHMYFLNTDYLHWRPHVDRNFTPDKERKPTNQDAIVRPLFWAGNLTCSNLSLQGVMKA